MWVLQFSVTLRVFAFTLVKDQTGSHDHADTDCRGY